MKPTVALFEEVIHTRGIFHTLGITKQAVKDLRRNHSAGKVSLDKMHEVLKLAGYQIVKPTLWAPSIQKVVTDRLIQVMIEVDEQIKACQPKKP